MRERSSPSEVRQGHEDPLSQHVLLVLTHGCSKDHLQDSGQQCRVRLAGADELTDDAVDHVTGGEEVNENLRENLSQ